jgi:hypothetical protein
MDNNTRPAAHAIDGKFNAPMRNGKSGPAVDKSQHGAAAALAAK